MKKLLILILMMAFLTTACSLNLNTNPEVKNWEMIVDSAEETSVNLVVQHSNPLTITWLEDVFVPYVLQTYKIQVKIIDQKLSKTMEELSLDQLNEVEIGKHDVILFERTGFKEAYEKGLLYGPFSDKMVELKTNSDVQSFEFTMHEGIDANHSMVPYGRRQLSFIYNQDVFYERPEDLTMFWDIVKEYKGQFTYPDPRSSYEGMAFILTVIGQNFDFEPYVAGEFDQVKFRAAIQSGMQALKEIKPFLKDQGKSYPASTQALDDLFINGALMMSMSMDYNYATSKLKEYEYPEGASTFVLPTGVATFTEVASIAYNAPNKAGAMVVIQALLSPEMQASKYNPKEWGSLTVFDTEVAPDASVLPFKSVKLKSSTVNYKEFMEAAMTEFTPEMRAIILDEWIKQVLNGN